MIGAGGLCAQTPPSTPAPAPASPAQPAAAPSTPPAVIDPLAPIALPTDVKHVPEYPAPPAEGIYVSDTGVVLSIDEQRTINKAAAKVKELTGLPVMVVTISSLEWMGADPRGAGAAAGTGAITKYGRDLFNHWSLGSAKDNKGVLLLVSRLDRQSRVTLGEGWGNSQDNLARRLEDTMLTPATTSGAYADGLIKAIAEVEGMYTRAGYPTEMPAAVDGVPGVVPAGGSPTTVPGAPGSSGLGSIGWATWVGIGVVGLVVIVLAAVLGRASKGG